MNHWIDSNQQLQKMCVQLAGVATVAIDTEFIRTDTFFPKIALIQISDGYDCWLVDVLAIDNFSGLKALLEDTARTLIFHACGEDLEVLEHGLDIRPANIFDTQIAAGIANVGYCMGYARLVNALFDVELDKQETRSDWLKRPLTDRQKVYAADDVLYLHRMRSLLSEAINEQGRQDWFAEETFAMFELAESRKDQTDYYLRVKGAWRLQTRSLNALCRLCDWREETARALDKPRSHVIKDTVLLELARRLPKATEQLQGIDDLHSRSIQRHGDNLLQSIVDSYTDEPLQPMPEPLPKAATAIIKLMRDALRTLAESQAIPQEFLSNKKELESLFRSHFMGQCNWPKRLRQGWRQTTVKPVLQAVVDRLGPLT
jgi:ribonuclease D